MSENRVLRVWERLHQMYGNSFLREHGDVPNDVWARMIFSLRDDEIIYGLEQLLNQQRDFPPNATEFRAACRMPQQFNQSQTFTDNEIKRLAPPTAAPKGSSLPPGMSPLAYAWEREKDACPVIEGVRQCVDSLSPRKRAMYEAGQYENRAAHEAYLEANA